MEKIMSNSEYTVRLEAFEGPLDLLLFLIRRAEVEIADIPIAEVTDQYLKHLNQLTARGAGARIDIEQAGEFLVMAATLMEIKSRMLTPRTSRHEDGGNGAAHGSDGEQAVDPRTELVRQLLEYKKFRDATDQLEDHRREWDHRFPSARAMIGKASADAGAEGPTSDAPVDIEDLQLIDLLQAFARIVESVDFNRVGEHHVKLDDTPIEAHGDRILDRLRAITDASGLKFAVLFETRSRGEMIGMFLALLELVKQQRVRVEQDTTRGEIFLRLAPESESLPMAATAVDSETSAIT